MPRTWHSNGVSSEGRVDVDDGEAAPGAGRLTRETKMVCFVQANVLRALTAVLVAWTAVSPAEGQAGSFALGSDSPRIEIDLARGTPREQLAKQTLEQVLASHDLSKYTFTRKVVIEQGASNHAFPILTLNAYFASSPDELLSSYLHEPRRPLSSRARCPTAAGGTPALPQA